MAIMTLEARSAGTSDPGWSNLAGEATGDGPDEYSTLPSCKRSINTETSNTDALTQHDLETRRSARRSIMISHRESQKEAVKLMPLLTTKFY